MQLLMDAIGDVEEVGEDGQYANEQRLSPDYTPAGGAGEGSEQPIVPTGNANTSVDLDAMMEDY
jgi:hypothetical protein